MYAMLMTLWLTLTEQAPRKARQHRRPAFRPRLEVLEDRALPSAYYAPNTLALIADITAANTAGGANTISLTAPTSSPYVLTAVNNSLINPYSPNGFGTNGLPFIAAKDNLTILGNGDTIERSTTVRPLFRLLDVASGASLTLENLTLQGGRVEGGYRGPGGPVDDPGGPGYGAAEGGAIYNQGTLVLNGVTVQGNVAAGAFPDGWAAGGGIFSLYGSVTLEGGTIVQNNEAEASGWPSNAYGGGLAAIGGTVTVTNATLKNNTARAGVEGGYAYGGGLYASDATLNLTKATLDGNAAGLYGQGYGYGGGLFLDADYGTATLTAATLTSCTVQGNSAGTGGGIYLLTDYPYSATVYLDPATVAQVTGNTASDGSAYDNIVGSYTVT